jgi:hypothetical protein
MLFDLRSRGRRRVVKVVYLGLALLLGGGLVLFGIGGEVSGGLVDAFNGGSSSDDNTFEDRVEKAREAVKERPQDPAAWAQLAVAEYTFAQDGEGMEEAQDPETGQVGRIFTETGRERLAAADRAWERHLEIADEPDPRTAASMVQLYAASALDDPAKGAEAAEIVIDGGEAAAGQYATLAVYAYRAGQTRKADLAADKALELAVDKDARKQLRQAFSEAQLDAGGQTSAPAPSG